jgi:tRNA modification GTPase
MIYSHDEETIIAQCTPIGSGALALIRLSGTTARAVATGFCKLSKSKTIQNVPSHTIHHGTIVDESGTVIDTVLFFVMNGPKTFTGQDTVELTCHNNQFIVQAIIEQAIKNGARLAQPGEFTKRAYLNKKIDLTQAEAINELISAHTQDALKKSLAQLEGSFTRWISTIQEQILQTLVLCEASFEFIEDESITFDEQIRASIDTLQKDLAQAQTHYGQQQQVKEGVRIALLGTVNAGKSSLFNALIGQDRAIVTEIAGTTRDAIEAGIYRNNRYLTYVDTAGLRQTHDRIEQEGIKRSCAQAEQADIILLVIDGTSKLGAHEQEIYQKLFERYHNKIILVVTKHDVKSKFVVANFDFGKEHPFLEISSTTGYNIDKLEQIITRKITKLTDQCALPFLINQRQHHLLTEFKKNLDAIATMIAKTIDYELVAIHLKDALEKLAELTGKTISEQSLDKIFHDFCIGK